MTTHNPEKIVLFVNGDLPEPQKIAEQLSSADFFIAVDGGLRHMDRLGIEPNLLIGDLDSIDEQRLHQIDAQGIEIRKFPEDKNQTDLELALDAALQIPPSAIWIVAALGGRLDQTLGNIFLLTRSDLAQTDVRLIDGQQEVFLIRNTAVIHGAVGQQVSLLPLGSPAEGIQTEGLAYPLVDETLYPDRTRGISNQMSGPVAKVSLTKGQLLCIHQFQIPTDRSG
jgi:thiamine pyrophosphokinase